MRTNETRLPRLTTRKASRDKWDLWKVGLRQPQTANRKLLTPNGEPVSGPGANNGGPGRPDA